MPVRHIAIGTAEIPKTIHVVVVIVYPTFQDTLLDTMQNGERFNKQSHSTSLNVRVTPSGLLTSPGTNPHFADITYTLHVHLSI
ncbi:MAG: hypothetical protein WAM42_07870 [Candidatus Nitrosopolaris sp.]